MISTDRLRAFPNEITEKCSDARIDNGQTIQLASESELQPSVRLTCSKKSALALDCRGGDVMALLERSAPLSRRGFVKAAASVAACSELGGSAVAKTALRPFEVAASLYAWELHDEGVEQILDNLQSMAQVNSVYLISIMHHEKRPFTSPTFPHNPVRKTWQAEDSRCYWHPDASLYGRIKPQLSGFSWLSETDWLNQLTKAARKRGLKTGAELSHTLVDQDVVLKDLADCTQRDIHDQPRVVWGRSFPLCPNNPDVLQYTLALYTDVVKNHDVDFVQFCTIPLLNGGADRGGCFCKSCVIAAAQQNIDLKKIQQELLANSTAEPAFSQWQQFRLNTMTRHYRLIHTKIHEIRAGIELRLNDCFPKPETWGIDLKASRPYLDAIRNSDYSEQLGDAARMHEKNDRLLANREALGENFPRISAVAVRPKATPELIHEGVHIAVENQVCGLSLGHYDGSEFPLLRAISEGLQAEHVNVPRQLAHVTWKGRIA
jgi:hypothetical protein